VPPFFPQCLQYLQFLHAVQLAVPVHVANSELPQQLSAVTDGCWNAAAVPMIAMTDTMTANSFCFLMSTSFERRQCGITAKLQCSNARILTTHSNVAEIADR
jgi:hypothetical protein